MPIYRMFSAPHTLTTNPTGRARSYFPRLKGPTYVHVSFPAATEPPTRNVVPLQAPAADPGRHTTAPLVSEQPPSGAAGQLPAKWHGVLKRPAGFQPNASSSGGSTGLGGITAASEHVGALPARGGLWGRVWVAGGRGNGGGRGGGCWGGNFQADSL